MQVQNQYKKIVASLYTGDELSAREIKKVIPFTIASKRLKYLRINLTKELEDLHIESYKILIKIS